jgi:ligand-binding SRPBCC domain-containing protein
MNVYSIKRETWVPHPLPEVFDFFSRAENLERLTPLWMRFRILTPQPIRMRVGTLIDYKLRVHGFPVKWRTRIENWNPPHEFVDLQLKGPYKLWHHTHRFIASRGGTLIMDDVRYGLPFGLLGRLVNRLMVSRDVAKIFDYRAEKIREFFPV